MRNIFEKAALKILKKFIYKFYGHLEIKKGFEIGDHRKEK